MEMVNRNAIALRISKRHSFVIFRFTLIITPFVIAIICLLFSNYYNIYNRYIYALPICFSISYLFFFDRLIWQKDNPIKLTCLFTYVLFFIKYIIYPFLLIFVGTKYSGLLYVSISSQQANTAIALICLEVIMAGITLYILSIWQSRKKREKKDIDSQNNNWILYGNKIIYIPFIFLAGVILIFAGKNSQLINFIAFDINGEGFVEVEGFVQTLYRQIIVCAFYIIVLIIFASCKKKYEISHKSRYVLYSIIAAMLDICIIVGDRRSVQMFTAILSIFLLVKMYPNYSKKIIVSIIGCAAIVIGGMTLYRLGAFISGSYFQTLSSSNLGLEWWLDMLQIYLGEPVSVATVLQFSENTSLHITNLIFDFTRLCFGPSFILKNYGLITSQLYNLYLYGNTQLTGQLVFSSGYGYMYFGYLGSWIIIAINLILACHLERKFRNASHLETKYLYGYCFLRVALNILVNTPTIISVVTMQFGTFGVLIVFAHLFTKTRQIRGDKL